MTDDRQSRRTIKTTDTVFDVVESLWNTNGATVTELADRLDIAKSTAHAHLATLEQREFVVKNGNTYQLSLRFLELGIHVRDQIELSRIAEPLLEKLAEETGEAIWLIVEEHGWAVYLNKAMGEDALQIKSTIGERSHLHYLAAGKALLAYVPHENVESIVERRGLPGRTSHTITEPNELFTELAAIRERGYAFNENEEIDGVRGVGVPICAEDRAIGAVGIGAPENRLRGKRFREEVPNQLLGAANEIELRITYSGLRG
ncbi:IclR family transcriptional regulator [Halocatena salina]|uniref:IclR family transcriptional regulator n=1 Tax=Halocatena salina TaxID=2934340 RepID=A0A8U0A567_9EURY|nr:IclR family transcriptional regulator [Halocatena salina]UPM44232.1 IclR family transcriptional regulator [Halocatena salina]